MYDALVEEERIKAEKKRIKSEFDRLNKHYTSLPKNKYAIAQESIRQLAWYNVQIAILQDRILTGGFFDEFVGENGSSAKTDSKTLNEYQKHSIALTKLLDGMLPEEVKKESKLSALLGDG